MTAATDPLWETFAGVLDSPAGRAAQIRAAALLNRADEHLDLVDPLRRHMRGLCSTN